jgi:hypothetical protein
MVEYDPRIRRNMVLITLDSLRGAHCSFKDSRMPAGLKIAKRIADLVYPSVEKRHWIVAFYEKK